MCPPPTNEATTDPSLGHVVRCERIEAGSRRSLVRVTLALGGMAPSAAAGAQLVVVDGEQTSRSAALPAPLPPAADTLTLGFSVPAGATLLGLVLDGRSLPLAGPSETDRELEQRLNATRARLAESQLARQDAEAGLAESRCARAQADADLAEAQRAQQDAEADLAESRRARAQADADLAESRRVSAQAQALLAAAHRARMRVESRLVESRRANAQVHARVASSEQARAQADSRLAQTLAARADVERARDAALGAVARAEAAAHDASARAEALERRPSASDLKTPRARHRMAGAAVALGLATVLGMILAWPARDADTGGGVRGVAAASASPVDPPTRATIRVDPLAARLNIPADYLALYRRAGARYGLDWTRLAAIGAIESGHGQARMLGITSGASTQGAIGPAQFLPGTWERFGLDGDGDGARDPRNAADAILAMASYLRASGAPQDWRAALRAYNHSDAYVTSVETLAASLRSDAS